MKPSLELAEEHFRTKVLPRRILEKVDLVQKPSGKIQQRKKYRKASRDETGELYPLFEFNARAMAQFGLGVSVYLLQLVIIAIISFLAGTIMIPAIHQYTTHHQGPIDDARLVGSATCTSPISVNATCSNNEICLADRREDCPLYQTNIICDIIMSVLLLTIFYLNMFVDEVEDRMDEVIQTAQDYSVVVRDPPPKTHTPDDYFVFFKRFGRVKNITVTKKNKFLGQLLLRKHLVLRQIDMRLHERVRDLTEYKNQYPHSWWVSFGQRFGLFTDADYWMNQLVAVNKKLNQEYKKVYDTCRVYVSFETEAEQRLCLRELSVSMLQSMSNELGRDRIMFNDKEVLSVLESAEPNNILWENLENSFTERSLRFIGAWLLSLLTMAASFLLIQQTYSSHPTFVPIVIGLIDSVLPTIFLNITIFECHIDEDDKQNSLMFKLYGARLLSSVFFTYVNTKWDAFLDEAQLTNILNIQLSASFVSPLIKSLDLYGVTMRWIVSPLVSNTQAEMNCYWEGTLFTLADRYTEISKILFISLFYSFLVPFGLFVSTVACLVLFAVDRYLLFRKTKPPPMLDATMASSMRNYLIFAVGAHMYVTTRIIYSWPFDSASWSDSQNSYVRVDKEADYMIWRLQPQSWHSAVQHRYLHVYKWFTLIIIGIMLYVFFLEPLKDFLMAFFFSEVKIETATSSSKPYSSIAGIVAYCPVVNYKTEKFIFADTKKMLTRHKPETITTVPNEECNLSEMVPKEKREDLLAVVQWYSDGTESDQLEEQVIDEDVISSVIKSAIPKVNLEQVEAMARPYLSMTPTTPDVIRIDIETPDDSMPQKPPTALELIAQREMEGSRIRRSIARQKLKSASVTPILDPQASVGTAEVGGAGGGNGNDKVENHEPVVFTREEVHLLRQLRKEFLALTINDLVRVDILPPNSSVKISFEEYLNILKKFAPDGLTRACPNSSAKTIQDIMKLHRPMLRRIYLKFLSTQNHYSAKLDHKIAPNNVQRAQNHGGSVRESLATGKGGREGRGSQDGGDGDAGKMDLIIFLEFIQNGLIVNLYKEQTKQQQQQQRLFK